MIFTTCNENEKSNGQPFVLILMILTIVILLAGLAESAHAKIYRSRFRVLNRIHTQKHVEKVYPLLAMHCRKGRVLTNQSVRELARIIVRESQKYSLDPVFIMALMYTESSFRPGVRSIADARGLMQVLPSTAKEIAEILGVEINSASELYSPELNVKLGVWYINSLLKQFNDPLVAITAYNYGPGYARRTIRRGRRFPTKNYVRKIANTYAKYLNDIGSIDNELVSLEEDLTKNSLLEGSSDIDYIITM